MVVLKTPDELLSVEIPTDAYRRLWFYTGGMFALITKVLALQLPDSDYEPTFQHLTNELILDGYMHDFRSEQPLIDLLKRSEPVKIEDDEHGNAEVIINFNCLPDQAGEIAYDKVLMRVQGAVHGLVAFFTAPKNGFYSPGNIVDMKQFFEYCSLDMRLLGPTCIKDAFTRLHEFLTQAAMRGQGALQLWDVDDEPES